MNLSNLLEVKYASLTQYFIRIEYFDKDTEKVTKIAYGGGGGDIVSNKFKSKRYDTHDSAVGDAEEIINVIGDNTEDKLSHTIADEFDIWTSTSVGGRFKNSESENVEVYLHATNDSYLVANVYVKKI